LQLVVPPFKPCLIASRNGGLGHGQATCMVSVVDNTPGLHTVCLNGFIKLVLATVYTLSLYTVETREEGLWPYLGRLLAIAIENNWQMPPNSSIIETLIAGTISIESPFSLRYRI
jgi:hypothetical protein